MPGIFHRKVTSLPDDPTADISSSEWNDALIIKAKTGETDTSVLGDVLVRAPAAADGWQFVATAPGVLRRTGSGVLPAFTNDLSTLNITLGSVATPNYVAIGAQPTQSGALRLPNSGYIYTRNSANNADRLVVGMDS